MLTRVLADRDIAPGEEVLISYGDLSSADLLTAYGFVEEPGSNPHDSLPLDLVCYAWLCWVEIVCICAFSAAWHSLCCLEGSSWSSTQS